MNLKSILLILLLLFIVFISCDNYTPEELEYIESIKQSRIEVDEWMKNDPSSPFNFKGKVEFHGLNYYDVDPDFVFKTKFVGYDDKKTVQVFGTKGEERSAVKFGYLPIKKDGKEYRLNLYANVGQDSTVYYSIWFTDKTTNNETYGVGRYLAFELIPNIEHVYTIDFNKAFNPYCAYTSSYSCAIPTKDDYLDLAITAGEKKYHD
ncbi:MAG: DUF1684 domain-containing protein [Melioribacteraceae bacterium]|nr:DUF1684 domain-containing protein [Melioribacteraceae bacterium]